MLRPSSLSRGALLGAGLGLALSVLLLIVRGGEGSDFYTWIAAAVLGAPISIALKHLGWIDQVSSLTVYVLLVVPLNWAVVGAAVGGLVQRRVWRRRT